LGLAAVGDWDWPQLSIGTDRRLDSLRYLARRGNAENLFYCSSKSENRYSHSRTAFVANGTNPYTKLL